jgi:hypothetical protein
LEAATIRSPFEGSQLNGISITDIKPNAIFRKLRMQNSDVITGVNWQNI